MRCHNGWCIDTHWGIFGGLPDYFPQLLKYQDFRSISIRIKGLLLYYELWGRWVQQFLRNMLCSYWRQKWSLHDFRLLLRSRWDLYCYGILQHRVVILFWQVVQSHWYGITTLCFIISQDNTDLQWTFNSENRGNILLCDIGTYMTEYTITVRKTSNFYNS
jgi:hypothetical protein